MSVNASNLLQGPVTLYYGAFGATEPTDLATPPGTGWTDLGGTSDGLEIEVADEWSQLTVDQVLMAPASRRTGRAVTAKSNLAEVTLENLARAITQAQPTTTGGVKELALTDGIGAFQPTYGALLADGYAPGGTPRRIILRKVVQSDSTAQSYKKDDQTLIPVTFMAHFVSASIPAVVWRDGVPAA